MTAKFLAAGQPVTCQEQTESWLKASSMQQRKDVPPPQAPSHQRLRRRDALCAWTCMRPPSSLSSLLPPQGHSVLTCQASRLPAQRAPCPKRLCSPSGPASACSTRCSEWLVHSMVCRGSGHPAVAQTPTLLLGATLPPPWEHAGRCRSTTVRICSAALSSVAAAAQAPVPPPPPPLSTASLPPDALPPCLPAHPQPL